MPGVAGLGKQTLRGAVVSQHDDWMHRGEHPILRDMGLYVYSVWVYRVEMRPSAAEKDDPVSYTHLTLPTILRV